MDSGVRTLFGILMALWIASPTAPFPIDNKSFKLRLIHTNDMHARFQQVSQSTGKCSEYEAKNNLCYGGFARMRTALAQELAKAEEENIPALSLNAGDSYQGTIWYTIFKWKIVLFFLEMLKIDVMSLGNHEFDDGIDGVLPFLNQTTIPVVTCNIDSSEEPEFQKVPVKNSIVLERGGRKIGIIGYVTPQTTVLSNTGKLKFEDEVASLTREAKKLNDDGIEIIIALGHSGYDVDMIIAEKVPFVDVVVGGHSHTFLYSGPPIDSEIPTDSYPIMMTQPSGRKVPVVQAYAFTKYLGKLDVTFDGNGEVVEAVGNPILLNYKIKEDPELLADLNEWHEKLNDTLNEALGKSRVVLDGLQCRLEECNLGNLITDAFIHHVLKNHSGPFWTETAIAIQQGGGIRATINATGSNGTITREDVMISMPFFSSVSLVKVTGKVLLEAMEWSVARYDKQRRWGRGEFLQFSGARVKYDLDREAGSRVVSARVRCASCHVPKYEALEVDADYQVIMPTFLLHGGDNFTMFKDSGIEIHRLETADTEIVMNYIQDRKIIYTGSEDRIEFVDSSPSTSFAIESFKFNNFLYLILFSSLFILN